MCWRVIFTKKEVDGKRVINLNVRLGQKYSIGGGGGITKVMNITLQRSDRRKGLQSNPPYKKDQLFLNILSPGIYMGNTEVSLYPDPNINITLFLNFHTSVKHCN